MSSQRGEIVGASLALMAVAAVGLVAGALAALGVSSALLVAALALATRTGAQPGRSSPVAGPDAAPFSFLRGRTSLLAAGFALRFGVVFLVNGSSLWMSFGPDAQSWSDWGEQLQQSWAGAALLSPELDSHRLALYTYLNAVCHAVFDTARYPMSMVNAGVGVLVAVLAGRLAERLYGPAAGTRTLVLVLFYPSLILWSSMNLRDVWAHAGVLLVLVAGLNARERVAPLSLALVFGSMGMLYLIRPYLLGLLVVALGVSLLVVRLRQLPYALLGLFGLVVFVRLTGDEVSFIEGGIEEQLEAVQRMREGLAYGGSAYGADGDTRTLFGALTYLPYGVAQFLFSPFPWNVRSWQQALALPESLLFLGFCVQAVRRVVGDLGTAANRVALPVAMVLVLTTAYGLVSGNEGTAFRHRAQVVVIVLVFAAAHQVRASVRASGSSTGSERQPSLSPVAGLR